MSNCPFCNLDPTPDASKPMTGLPHRAWQATQWLFPSLLLVAMPKCPMCVAAYITLFTGIGITASTARWIYILIPVLCFTSLTMLISRFFLQRIKMRRFKTV